ncbi:MAG: tRNA methyltransferase, catalyzes esterification of modified uridine nucleotides in tRNA [Parcubacteria group bacterium Gr01-1014_13]|nr:MAG: tRNA methyltransferase, catalyzes esterification of modified uridine nucleotides in tRNA [Parcubacteria group bacterium Gr01-1014_13]
MAGKDTATIIHKTRKDYNRIAKYFDSTRNNAGELEIFKKFIKNGQNILDWGCGNGRLIFLLQNKKVNYFGTDQSEGLLKIARKNHKKAVTEGWAKFFSTASRKKIFPKGFFDLVFMIASFHHLPDKQSRSKILEDVYKQLKPGGKLIITVWNLESDWAKDKIDTKWQQIGENDFLVPWSNPQGEVLANRYYHHFPKDELAGLLKETGFRIKKMDYAEKTNWTDKKGGRNLVVIASK